MIPSYSLELAGVDPSRVRVRQEQEGHRHRFVIRLPEGLVTAGLRLHLQIKLDARVLRWRNFDYKWVNAEQVRMAGSWSPKILELEGDWRMVAGETHGTWRYDPRQAQELTWILADPLQQPRLHYDANDHPLLSTCSPARNEWVCTFLFTRSAVPEFSRSRIPFSAILNISDHCDFDSPVLLERQRRFLRRLGLNITKGVFLFHHSKRPWNVSMERQADLLRDWAKDGHELCYHSLSQSTRASRSEWEDDFDRFVTESGSWTTWIDHGFQPYNLSRIPAAAPELIDWARGMRRAGVRLLWNYLDAGQSGPGRINQLNPKHFSLSAYRKTLMQQFSQSGVFELLRSYNLFFCGVRAQKRYQQLAAWLRKKAWRQSWRIWPRLLAGSFRLLAQLLRVVFFGSGRLRLPEWQKMTPILFEVGLGGQRFWLFQTVEVHDFAATFSQDNLNVLMGEAGVCLAHTYLADTDRRKSGRLFADNKGHVMPGAKAALERLSLAVAEEKIWMPTLQELRQQAELLAGLRFVLDERGQVVALGGDGGELPPIRYV